MDMSFLKDVPGALQKGKTRKQLKARKDREDAKRLNVFRDQVWAREQIHEFVQAGSMIARCQHCKSRVWRNLDPIGEVHHRIPRSRCTPEQRYDPNNGVLLCQGCHGKAQRREIQV